MERKSLDEILENVKNGRAVSPAGIINTAKNLMYTPVKDLIDGRFDDNKEPCWVREYSRETGITDTSRTYIESVAKIRKKFENGSVTASLYMAVSALKLGGSKPVRMWMRNSIEDAMKTAGLETYFNTWLKEDVRLWEKVEGRAPSIGDLMQICFYSFGNECNEDDRVLPMTEQKQFLFKDVRVTKPFVRFEEDINIWNLYPDRRVQLCDAYTRLVCVWVWLLMQQAPLAILNKKFKK